MTATPTSSAAKPDASPPTFDVRRFGARGDGATLDTAAINRAIAAAAAAGGGVVVFTAGDYLSHSLRLQSRVTLELQAGATLIAADPPSPGQPGGYDAPEEGPPNLYQDFGHSRFRNSLIWGEDLEHVGIRGAGCIFGRGLSRGNGRIASPLGQVAPQPPGHLPDVLEADGEIVSELDPAPVPGPFGYPHALDTLPAGVGNKAIALRHCRYVAIEGVTILHGGHFAILASGCADVAIDRVLIDTNRDGIDIDGCRDVRLTQCRVNSPWDDGICIKSSFGMGEIRPVENVTVTDCYVSGFVEGTLFDGTRRREIQHRGGPIGRIKLGTEGTGGFRNIVIRNCAFEFCRGLALELVDGASMEDVEVSNLTMSEVMNAPIFVRVGGRLRGPAPRPTGRTARIAIRHVVASPVAWEHGIFLAGVPGHPVSDVTLEDIEVQFRGGGTVQDAARPVPEMVADYPEPMLFGALPAWGVYVRHAERVTLRNLRLSLLSPDARPAVMLEDVARGQFAHIRFAGGGAFPRWALTAVQALDAQDCDGI